MEDRRVEIRNTTNGLLIYKIPGLHVSRSFMPGMKMKVGFEELQEGLCDLGIKRMFNAGYLICLNQQDAIDLGLSEAPNVNYIKTKNELKELLSSDSPKDIYLMMKNANGAMRDSIISVLVSERIYDNNIVKWCKDLYDYDLLAALKITQE